MSEITLTEEQRAIVQHDHGPAVVFAVAGSGKTTAMVHRIERLVREGIFQPEKILATSFSKACVADLEAALARWPHCQGVDTRTIHSLGLRLLREAPPGTRPVRPGRGGVGGKAYDVLRETLRRARGQDRISRDKLDDLDAEDFLSYVSACKGELAYADLKRAELPPRALEVAKQATRPDGLHHYLDLYRLYEEVRAEMGVVTFDDMLMGGLEVLHRHPELAQRAQSWYDCVIVDEFQDVNLAQHEILKFIAAPQDNTMVVGD
ncbi:MAG: UvrD-helicase domain-containing protein, partial [Candidatus Thermoplasmatota archaeon]|nr:UvrD-helicase domain-containing protein [Candidatus Thermoplasmatota archaeon]